MGEHIDKRLHQEPQVVFVTKSIEKREQSSRKVETGKSQE